jgi:hypothetical protein
MAKRNRTFLPLFILISLLLCAPLSNSWAADIDGGYYVKTNIWAKAELIVPNWATVTLVWK